jgi:hypothetical protein
MGEDGERTDMAFKGKISEKEADRRVEPEAESGIEK